MISKFLVTAVTTALLTACGGGGESNSFNDGSPETEEPLNQPHAQYGASEKQAVTLFDPVGPAKGLVVWVHGGGWVGGDKDEDVSMFESLPQEGLAVLNVNYRLGAEGVFPHSVNDIQTILSTIDGAACVDCTNLELWARAREYAASGGMLISGASAGGYLSVYAGAEHIQKNSMSHLKCLGGMVAPADVRHLNLYTPDFADNYLTAFAGGDISAENLALMSPTARFESNAWQNTMTRKWHLIYSKHDVLVPLQATESFSSALNKAGAVLSHTVIDSPTAVGGHSISWEELVPVFKNEVLSCFSLR